MKPNQIKSYFYHTTCESTSDTLASSAANQVAQGGTATPGPIEQLLPPDRGGQKLLGIARSGSISSVKMSNPAKCFQVLQKDLSLNNLQWLTCHETQLNQIIYLIYMYK